MTEPVLKFPFFSRIYDYEGHKIKMCEVLVLGVYNVYKKKLRDSSSHSPNYTIPFISHASLHIMQ